MTRVIPRHLSSRLPQTTSLLPGRVARSNRAHSPWSALAARSMASKVDSEMMSKMTEEEKKITGQAQPVKGGPTAQTQKHANQPINAGVVHDITKGEEKITGDPNPMQAGPTATAQSILSQSGNVQTAAGSSDNQQEEHSGVLDSSTISRITDAEKKITGDDQPVRRGPTARAQQHTGETITAEALHDITEGEKKVTGGERVKGGPTSTAQSELGKARS